MYLFKSALLVKSTPESVTQDAYAIADDTVDMEMNLLHPLITPTTEIKVLRTVLHRNITVDENTDVILKCTPDFQGDNVNMPRILLHFV